MASVRLHVLDDRRRNDVEALLEDPTVLRFTRVPEPPPADFAERWIGRYVAGNEVGSCAGFAVIGPAGEFLGLGLAPRIDGEGGEVELGYIVARAHRGHGVGTAILRELTAWAFAELRAERAYLIIDVDNPASYRVAERCGYQLEGVMRSIHVKQGRRADASLWSRLRSDPPLTPGA